MVTVISENMNVPDWWWWLTSLILLQSGARTATTIGSPEVVEQFILRFSDASISDLVWVSRQSQGGLTDLEAHQTNRCQIIRDHFATNRT